MKYISYSDGTIEFLQSNQPDPTEYIFAIDGSASMRGTPWQDQLKGLKEVLSSISDDFELNKASVLVFNDKCLPKHISENPRNIMAEAIQFPGGSTTPDPTFKKAAQIINDALKQQGKNFYFFYISDGQADHPTEGIRQLLECKRKIEKKNFSFNYTSILIGNDPSGNNCMQKINSQMGGRSEYIPNASSLSKVMKQILAK